MNNRRAVQQMAPNSKRDMRKVNYTFQIMPYLKGNSF